MEGDENIAVPIELYNAKPYKCITYFEFSDALERVSKSVKFRTLSTLNVKHINYMLS